MKKVTKIALIAAVLMGFVGGLFAAAGKYDLTYYKPGKMSFDVGVGWVGYGIGVVTDFDFNIGNFNLGFGPINYKIGVLADVGTYLFGFTTFSGSSSFYLNFAIGPVFSISWALGNVIPDNSFLNKVEFFWGLGAGFYYDGFLAAWDNYWKTYYGSSLYTSLYSPFIFITKAGAKYHFSDSMAIILQECWTYTWNSTIGIEFKF